ncbi:MAG: hydrogen gas-evolving membrane-bound hydrogenase subunit E [Bacillota bacterium]
MRGLLMLALAGVIVFALAGAVAELPAYGRPNPTHNLVYERYVEAGVRETGAVNVVTQIIVDYRAYDTLIETTVLFAAIASVLLLNRAVRKDGGRHG